MKTFGAWCLLFALLAPKIAANAQMGNVPEQMDQRNAAEVVAAVAANAGMQSKSFYPSSMVTSSGSGNSFVYPQYPPSWEPGTPWVPQPPPRRTLIGCLLRFLKNVVWRIITLPFRIIRGINRFLLDVFGCPTGYPGGFYPGSTSQIFAGGSSSPFPFPTVGYS